MAKIGSVGLQGMDDFRSACAALKARIEQAARVGIAEGAMMVERTAKHNVQAMVQWPSGRLMGSIHSVVDITGPPRATVGTNVEYAEAVEFGWKKWGRSHKTGLPFWWAPVGATAAGRRWLADHGLLVGARQSLAKGHAYSWGSGLTPDAPVFEYQGITYLRVSGDPAKHPPRPFLLPALEANRQKIVSRIAMRVRRAAQSTSAGG